MNPDLLLGLADGTYHAAVLRSEMAALDRAAERDRRELNDPTNGPRCAIHRRYGCRACKRLIEEMRIRE